MSDLVWYEYECVECHKVFAMGKKQIHHYEDKGLKLPKRCTECRKKRKNKKRSG